MITWDESKRKKNLKAHGTIWPRLIAYSTPRWSQWKTNASRMASSGCEVWVGFVIGLSFSFGRSAMTAPE
jgi:uncharacterized protein YcsI (UPF0317 family)